MHSNRSRDKEQDQCDSQLSLGFRSRFPHVVLTLSLRIFKLADYKVRWFRVNRDASLLYHLGRTSKNNIEGCLKELVRSVRHGYISFNLFNRTKDE